MPRYKKVWGYKRQVYVDLTPKKWVDHDVKVLHDAMSGLGTDEAELIRTLANRTSAQIAEISKAFSEKYGAKGDLIKWIKDDTSFDVERVLVAMARDEADADAVALHKAMKGLGTDDAALMDILVDRSPAEVQRISESFRNKFGSKGDLAAWIADDTSGNYKDVLLALADRATLYANMLDDALKSSREGDALRLLLNLRNHELFRAILRDRNDPLNIAYDLEKELDDEFATPALDEVKAAFEGLHGQSLEDAVRGATSGRSQEVLLLLLEDPATRDAKELREAILSKLEYKVIELLVLRSPRERAAIAEAYSKMYSVTLAKDIEAVASFNFKKTLLRLVRPKGVNLAHALKKAMSGGLTRDDDRLISLLTHRSKKEIREAAEAYKELFNVPLIQDLRQSTSGWYRKTLLYIVREAFELRVHIRKRHLHLVRDVDV